MFQSIQVDQVFDMNKAMASGNRASYWLAQLRRLAVPVEVRGCEAASENKETNTGGDCPGKFEFVTCDGRGDVWRLWNEMRNEHRIHDDPVPSFRVGLVS
ncbi:hypothetical protein [Candidatus Villigracilis saccharophilus]|uniref:hypothetical protein n=1 Tax=Candidatus Villigracilis saccharophilus TaxID=3140684 RepID=UPI0031356D13|nr:hypothetical protein [Anaerolineales bacterium]